MAKHIWTDLRVLVESLVPTEPITMADVIAIWDLCKPLVQQPYKLDISLECGKLEPHSIIVRVYDTSATGTDNPIVFERLLSSGA